MLVCAYRHCIWLVFVLMRVVCLSLKLDSQKEKKSIQDSVSMPTLDKTFALLSVSDCCDSILNIHRVCSVAGPCSWSSFFSTPGAQRGHRFPVASGTCCYFHFEASLRIAIHLALAGPRLIGYTCSPSFFYEYSDPMASNRNTPRLLPLPPRR